MTKKKVVYLFGAGATQAVLKSIDPSYSLLTSDIQTNILNRCHSKSLNKKVWNELTTLGNDIEHLISVLESQHHYYSSERIRKYYRDAIVDISKEISEKPSQQNLYSVLIDLHKNVNNYEEELLCFITLNYEDILEQTVKKIFNLKVDYSLYPNKLNSNSDSIKVLKLHGSFNWINTRPITIRKMVSASSSRTLWIPPGVEKRKENYPFNILWGKAIENLMECDVLRIVGCSLSRNDWGLIPILYTVQRFDNTGDVLDIELIDYPSVTNKIIDDYGYMKFKTLTEMPDFMNFYRKQFPNASQAQIIDEIKANFSDKDKSNPFYDWLDAKIDYAIEKLNLNIKTSKNIVNKFYYKV